MPEVGFDQPQKIESKRALAEKKLGFFPLDEINKDDKGQIRIIEGLNGPIAFSSSKGIRYKDFNEDIQYLNTWSNFFASIDGMGGMGEPGAGRKAAFILAEEIQKGINKGQEMKQIHLNAHFQLKRNGVGEGGACFLTAQIKGRTLEIHQAGDVRAVVIKKNGQILETKDECLPHQKHTVYNCLQGDYLGKMTTEEFPLEEGDRVVIASDGVWDNFYLEKDSPQRESTENLVKLIKNQPLKAAANIITNWLKIKMSSPEGKPDNYNFIIYDFVKPPRKNLTLAEAENLREVLLSFDRITGLQGSKQFFSPEALKSVVKRFFTGELTANHLTRSEGLREKILQLA